MTQINYVDEYPIYCHVCCGYYKTSHEVNSPECYEHRIEKWKRIAENRGELDYVCETCQTPTKVKYFMNTVQGCGCIYCVSEEYVKLRNDAFECFELIEKYNKEYGGNNEL